MPCRSATARRVLRRARRDRDDVVARRLVGRDLDVRDDEAGADDADRVVPALRQHGHVPQVEIDRARGQVGSLPRLRRLRTASSAGPGSITQNFCLSGARWATLPAVRRGVNGGSRRRRPALPAGAGCDAPARADRERHLHRRVEAAAPARPRRELRREHRRGPRGARAAGRRRPRARALGTGHVRHGPARGGAALPRLGRRADGRRGADRGHRGARRHRARDGHPRGAPPHRRGRRAAARDRRRRWPTRATTPPPSSRPTSRCTWRSPQRPATARWPARWRRCTARCATRSRSACGRPSRRTGCRRSSRCHQELVEAVAAQDLGGAGAAMDAHARPPAHDRHGPRAGGVRNA